MNADARAIYQCGTCSSDLCEHGICRTCTTCPECDDHDGLCEHGICRICGTCPECDDHDADLEPADANRIDAGGGPVICSRTPEDRAVKLAALRELRAQQCVCGTVKREGQSFCRQCWRSLPPDVQAGLHKRFADGYMTYYRHALEILRDAGHIASGKAR